MELRNWLLAEIETHRFQVQLTAGAVPPTRWAERPYAGANPVAWLVWHIARWHDIAVNNMLRDVAPVFDATWAERVGVAAAPGTGFDDGDVDELAAAAQPEALLTYLDAVLSNTTQWLETVPTDELSALLAAAVDSDARYEALGDELLPTRALWVKDFMRGQHGQFHLRWVAIGHTYYHLGELCTVTTALGYPVG